ncbi:MAG: DUF3604 domain-containing protein [Hyphomicrobiales bacterium]
MNESSASRHPEASEDAPLAGLGSAPIAAPIPQWMLGHTTVSPAGSVEAGSYQTFTIVYTAGEYGIDDSGALRLCFRFASDQTPPQFTDPGAAGYTTIAASNGAVLEHRFDVKGNVRPWDKCIYIKVVQGYLKKGDTITIVLGDTSQGSPGMRVQTFCESSFEFQLLVDPIATCLFQPVANQPVVAIVPGKPAGYAAVLPTRRHAGETFSLKVKGEDVWGNPSDKCDIEFALSASMPVEGLPKSVKLEPGRYMTEVSGLKAAEQGDLVITLTSADGKTSLVTNPLRLTAAGSFRHFWADLHGQSEETVGTGSAWEYFAFARDRAFVDACAHQGNDFQMTNAFWRDLNALCAEFDEPGRFVAIPGYEWSGNTALGGDRNVFFPVEGRTIRRSSHALLEDQSDIGNDAFTARDLFKAFAESGEWDVRMYAHCGGRYADIKFAHDGRFEKSVEVHSSWGSFEWLFHDALEAGHRVGIVCNSDGHKGRPGASYPGASMFGAIGGLTCFLTDKLDRASILECIDRRHHYGTTGGNGGRLVIDMTMEFDGEAVVYHQDPNVYPDAQGSPAKSAMMGDIVNLKSGGARLEADIRAARPIERIEIFNGPTLLETIRPYDNASENRFRIIWEGAKYRGRARQVYWDGGAEVTGNGIEAVSPINFFNPDRTLDLTSPSTVAWKSLTTGNFAGLDMWMTSASGGRLGFRSGPVSFDIGLDDIGLEDTVFDASEILPRRVRLFRLPAKLTQTGARLTLPIEVSAKGDNPILIKLTQEDGTIAWTSPVYLYR